MAVPLASHTKSSSQTHRWGWKMCLQSGTVWQFLKKLSLHLPDGPAMALLSVHPTKVKTSVHTRKRTWLVKATLFAIKQLKYTSLGEWRDRRWYMGTLRWYIRSHEWLVPSHNFHGPPGHQAEWEKASLRWSHAVWLHLYTIFKRTRLQP